MPDADARSLDCRRAVALMSDYVEGALAEGDRRRLKGHLATCPPCIEYLAQIRATIAAAGQVEPDELPAAALDELVELYRAWRRD